MNVAVVLLMLQPLPSAMDDPEESISAGAEALDSWRDDYPWYDDEADDVRRVGLREPEAPSTGSSGPLLPGSFMQWVAWIMITLALAALLGVLIWILLGREWGDVPASGGAAVDDQSDADRVEALPFPVQSGRKDLLGQAQDFYRNGDYAKAIVYLFSYQLVQLDKRQIIRLSKGKTNRRYLREIGTRFALLRLVEETMVTFEGVFFGHHPLDRPQFESCWSRLAEFQSLAGEMPS